MCAYHLLGVDLPVALNIPETQRACDRSDRLCKTKIRVLQKREREEVILDDGNERPGRVKSISEKEIGCEIDEGIWELLVLFTSLPDLRFDFVSATSIWHKTSIHGVLRSSQG